MSSFQRLIAIPQEEYIQLNTMQQVHQPLAQQINNVLNQKQSFNNPYDEMVKQGSVLEEVKSIKEKIRNELSLGTPKPYRNRALSLYRTIEPHVQFNQRGEMLDANQKPIEDSRAEDLIQHAVRDRRRNFTPTAWKEFLGILKHHNVPKAFLNQQTLDELAMPPTSTSVTKRKSLLPIPSKETNPMKKRIRKPSSRYPEKDFLTKF